jgi:hypothetical protein
MRVENPKIPRMQFSILLFFLILMPLLGSCRTASGNTGISGSRESEAYSPTETESTFPAARETEPAAETAAEETKTPAPKEPPPAAPHPSMNREQLMLAVARAAGQRFTPIRRSNGTPLMNFMDIDRNGELDAFVLTIERGNLPAIEETLSDVGRLYQSEAEPVNYYLSVYFQIDGELISMYRIPFGGRMVLEGFRAFRLDENSGLPYVVEATFQNRDGIACEWVIFSSYNKFSLFSMKKAVAIGTYITDIDGNGMLDVVEWRKGIEEGTGYETFLTWYKWNGSSFRENGSTNIVRKLNAFLAEVETGLLSKNPETLIPYLSDREGIGNSPTRAELVEKIFTPIEEIDFTDFDRSCEDIVSIVYPPILESPFSMKGSEGRIFPLDLRLVCRNGQSLLFRMEISLSDNPFSDPQYRISAVPKKPAE